MKVQNPLKQFHRRNSFAKDGKGDISNSSGHTTTTDVDVLSSSFKSLSSSSRHSALSTTSTVTFADDDELCQYHPSSYELTMDLEDNLWYCKGECNEQKAKMLDGMVRKLLKNKSYISSSCSDISSDHGKIQPQQQPRQSQDNAKDSYVAAVERWHKKAHQVVVKANSSSPSPTNSALNFNTSDEPLLAALTQEYQANEYYRAIGLEHKLIKKLLTKEAEKSANSKNAMTKFLSSASSSKHSQAPKDAAAIRQAIGQAIQKYYHKDPEKMAQQCRALTTASVLFAQGIAQAAAATNVY
mmetsp:Transcript_22291/g.48433  ORF Transcript_22291/g.48433 Transcript_22291/m.48433 type:complete len:298 (+) Transcript_22291:418-1311(+)|eukprot:CAMPEP_0168753064 /NCGR_PEP_ID=MMETSP0724-20121128/18730_1 /TAXON_ID=265536 /ORGANISM="Amphiprora sp., Strain CCMP467" /LENGTH=297 /DNA_ID=CAMNT_0008801375 /DNA_START=329 /DNA_END=1222 /DNA_ORIENTATION=-